MISGQLFGIILLNLIVDGLGDMEATDGYEDPTPFQCNDQNQPGGSDEPSSKARCKSVNSLYYLYNHYKHCSKY